MRKSDAIICAYSRILLLCLVIMPSAVLALTGNWTSQNIIQDVHPVGGPWADINYANSPTMSIDNIFSTPYGDGFVKVSLLGNASILNSAVLNYYVSQYGYPDQLIEMYHINCTAFDENTLTYNTQASQCDTTGGELIATSPGYYYYGWFSVDITEYLNNSDKTAYFRFSQPAYSSYFATSENSTHTPYLQVNYEYFQSDPYGLADGSSILFVDKSNTACDNAYSRATALNPATPWCNLDTALDKVLGNDTVYVYGNQTYFGYFDLQNRKLSGSLKILGYPATMPNLTMGAESVWNGTASWTNLTGYSGRNIWYTTFSSMSSSRGFITLPNGSTMLTSTSLSDVTGSTGAIGICMYNATAKNLVCSFNQTSFNPNGQKIHARGNQQETVKIENTDANILIAGFRIPNSDYGIYALNVTNLTIENCTFFTNRYDIYINSGTGGKLADKINIRNNQFDFHWSDAWTWADFYTSGITNAQPGHILLDGQNGPIKSVFIRNNSFSGSFDGIRQKMTTTSSEDHEYSYNNFTDIHDDAFEIGETTNQNTTINNNYLWDVFVCFSTAPANSTLGMSYIYNNLCYANKSVFHTRPSTYWPGKAVKNYNDSGKPASANWTWSHNLLYGGGTSQQSTAWETRTPYAGQVNFNYVTNNILYTNDAYVMKGSGNNTNTLFDYNNYYREVAGNLGQYWGLESDATPRASLAAAKAAAGWPAMWDVHSTNLLPGYNTSNSSYGGKAYLLENSSMIDGGVSHSWRTSDFFGNSIYGIPDVGPVEYQPPYEISTQIHNSSIKVYHDGKYRLFDPATTSVGLRIEPSSGFGQYSRPSVIPSFANVEVTTWNSAEINLTLNLYYPANLTLDMPTRARMYRNGAYFNKSVFPNVEMDTITTSALYSFKFYDAAIFDGATNTTSFYYGSAYVDNDTTGFAVYQATNTEYHVRNYRAYTENLTLNFTFNASYTCDDFTQLNYTSDTGAYSYILENGVNVTCDNSSKTISATIYGIEPATGSNTITLVFDVFGTPYIGDGEYLETEAIQFGLYFSSVLYNVTSVTLMHNGTAYPAKRYQAGATTWYNKTAYAPIIAVPSDLVYFNWIVYYTNGTNESTHQYNYSVAQVWLDNCTISANETLHYYIFDEDHPDTSLTAEFQITGNYWISSRAATKNFSYNFSGSDNYQICIYWMNKTVHSDIYAKYNTSDGFWHNHYLANISLTNTSQTQNIYNFATTTDISDVKITLRDKYSYKYLKDTILKLQRYYLPENTWRTVQMDNTDEFGLGFFNIREEHIDYRLIATDWENVILSESQPMKFVCTATRCELTYLVDSHEEESEYNTTFSINHDNSSGIIRITWDDPDDIVHTIQTVITTRTYAGAHETVCNRTTSAVNGVTECDLAGRNGTFFVSVNRFDADNESSKVYSGIIDVQTAKELYKHLSNKEGAFWSFAITLTLCAAGAAVSPVVALGALVLSMVALYYFKFLTGLTFGILVVITAMTVVIAKKVKS